MSAEPLLEKALEKAEVRDYFNSTGFERWNRIYSDSDEVNKVQRNIRIGHQKTVDQVLLWLQEEGESGWAQLPRCRLWRRQPQPSPGPARCRQHRRQRPLRGDGERGGPPAAAADLGPERIQFSASDLESLSGRYDTVICLDVFIHYPQEPAEQMVRHLASMAERRLLVSFAPYTPLLAALKSIGQLFPGPSKTTRAYTLREDGIVAAAATAGFQPLRRSLNTAPFYFSRLIEFGRS